MVKLLPTKESVKLVTEMPSMTMLVQTGLVTVRLNCEGNMTIILELFGTAWVVALVGLRLISILRWTCML